MITACLSLQGHSNGPLSPSASDSGVESLALQGLVVHGSQSNTEQKREEAQQGRKVRRKGLFILLPGYPRHRENRGEKKVKWQKKIPVRENTGNLESLPKQRENRGNFVCSSCKFPDSKGKGYCDICRENCHFFPEAG